MRPRPDVDGADRLPQALPATTTEAQIDQAMDSVTAGLEKVAASGG